MKQKVTPWTIYPYFYYFKRMNSGSRRTDFKISRSGRFVYSLDTPSVIGPFVRNRISLTFDCTSASPNEIFKGSSHKPALKFMIIRFTFFPSPLSSPLLVYLDYALLPRYNPRRPPSFNPPSKTFSLHLI